MNLRTRIASLKFFELPRAKKLISSPHSEKREEAFTICRKRIDDPTFRAVLINELIVFDERRARPVIAVLLSASKLPAFRSAMRWLLTHKNPKLRQLALEMLDDSVMLGRLENIGLCWLGDEIVKAVEDTYSTAVKCSGIGALARIAAMGGPKHPELAKQMFDYSDESLLKQALSYFLAHGGENAAVMISVFATHVNDYALGPFLGALKPVRQGNIDFFVSAIRRPKAIFMCWFRSICEDLLLQGWNGVSDHDRFLLACAAEAPFCEEDFSETTAHGFIEKFRIPNAIKKPWFRKACRCLAKIGFKGETIQDKVLFACEFRDFQAAEDIARHHGQKSVPFLMRIIDEKPPYFDPWHRWVAGNALNQIDHFSVKVFPGITCEECAKTATRKQLIVADCGWTETVNLDNRGLTRSRVTLLCTNCAQRWYAKRNLGRVSERNPGYNYSDAEYSVCVLPNSHGYQAHWLACRQAGEFRGFVDG